jgi:RNA recognition motif-containing protein
MYVYVRNLSPETSVSELRGCFESFGTVADVTISTYRLGGMAKAFGQVEMSSHDHAWAAITGLHGKELRGNLLKVNDA